MRQITITASSCADCPTWQLNEALLDLGIDEKYCINKTKNYTDHNNDVTEYVENKTFHPDCPMVEIREEM